MYQVDELDRVIEAEDLPPPDVGAPEPIILAVGGRCVVGYFTSSNAVCVLEFDGVQSLIFGAPNDEAFEGHPLADRGLEPYSIARIERSSWIGALERMNSVHDCHDPERFERLTHFILSFHDEMLEVAAGTANIVGDFADDAHIVRKMSEILWRHV